MQSRVGYPVEKTVDTAFQAVKATSSRGHNVRVSTPTWIKMASVALVLPLAAACGGNDQDQLESPPDAVLPQSATFGQPQSIPVGDGSMSLTVEPLRLETNSSSSDNEQVLIADVGATAEFGNPYIDPAQFHAYAPDGGELKRMDTPESFLANPLVRSDLGDPGEVTEGSVGFVVPAGLRVGRLDVVTPEATLSYTIVKQPVDPSATPTDSPD